MNKTKIFRSLRIKGPTILSCLAIVGVFSTAVAAIVATPKAMKKIEKMREPVTVYYDNEPATITPPEPTKKAIIKAVWKDYIPAAAMGVGTTICILGSNILNKQNQAMITSAYALLNTQFRRYSDEVKRRFGKETHEDILNTMIVERAKKVTISAPGLIDSEAMIFDPDDENELLFYDVMSKRYFNSTIGHVLSALYHLNRNFCLGASPDANMYYDFLGIDGVENGEYNGWSIEDGIYWIDFEIFKETADNGTLEYYVINPMFWPEPFPTED